MLLKRKNSILSGVFRASSFVKKPANSSGLKSGAYFVTLETCQEIEVILKNANPNRMGSRKKSRKGGADHSPLSTKRQSPDKKLTQAKVVSPSSLAAFTPEGAMLASFGSNMFLPHGAMPNPVWISQNMQVALANQSQVANMFPFMLGANGIQPSMMLMGQFPSPQNLLFGGAGFPPLQLPLHGMPPISSAGAGGSCNLVAEKQASSSTIDSKVGIKVPDPILEAAEESENNGQSSVHEEAEAEAQSTN
jgi:hypothetical protein